MKFATIVSFPLMLQCFIPVAVEADEYFTYFSYNNDIVEVGKSCSQEEWTLITKAANSKVPPSSAPTGSPVHPPSPAPTDSPIVPPSPAPIDRPVPVPSRAPANPVAASKPSPAHLKALGKYNPGIGLPKHGSQRNLWLWKNSCKGSLTVYSGTCGIRTSRRLDEVAPSRAARGGGGGLRGLSALENPCGIHANEAQRINATVQTIFPRLSPTCQALTRTPLEVTCMQKVECDIMHFTMWNTKTGKVLVEKVPETGGVFCNNATISFEAVTHFDVGQVNMAWTGPMWPGTVWNGKMDQFNSPFNITEPVSPYFMFGKHKNGTYGMSLPAGNFTLTATSSKNANKAKKISFTMKRC